jgi:deazaflavin-dependent oxidoreductase (nitroreductase family)
MVGDRTLDCEWRTTEMAETEHYIKPTWFTRNVFNPAVRGLTRLGISIRGSRVLEVKGRKSGEPRYTAVNLLNLDGRHYLVAPRGQAQWVKNVRADEGRLTLHVGRHHDRWVATELADGEKVPLLREYLRLWSFEGKSFFDGVGADSSDEQIATIAGRHPIFSLDPAAG